MNKVIIIAGPTATGKTNAAIEVAKQVGAEVVNFDSLLFYKELNIGTAKPSQEELTEVTHHMVNTHSAKNPLNAADYLDKALPIIEDIHQRNKPVILVGGSGFYLQALLYGMFESKTTSPDIQKKSDELYNKSGISPFLKILEDNDQESFSQYHENDHYRIRRAVEHFWTTQTPFSKVRQQMLNQRKIRPQWDIFFTYLDIPKPEHFEIIQKRTKNMFTQGLVAEVKNLIENFEFTGQEKPLKSIGYKEVVELIKGHYQSEKDCQERINISTRQLAKSQRTWFKKIEKRDYNILINEKEFISDCLEFIKK